MRDLAIAGEVTEKHIPGHSALNGAVAVPILTILYHPSLDRIGDYALLPELDAAQEVLLSRRALEFWSIDRSSHRPLEDTFISRTALRLSCHNQCYRLDVPPNSSAVTVQGVSIEEASYSISCEELSRGVVISIAERVVLFWQTSAAPPPFKASQAAGLVGNCAAIAEIRRDIARVGPMETDVLLLGESGTGKELVAKAIHQTSRRSSRAWVPVNMAAIPSSLATSELFGSTKGAFTGAERNHTGYFASADGGTLFLDEIGDAPMEVQATLLRAIESREIQPVGGKPLALDLRIISATDADLDARTRDQTFKMALLHRLANFEITLPALRDRRSDIGILAIHFLREHFAAQSEPERLTVDSQDPGMVREWATLFGLLAAYDWPGNVRELRNLLYQIVVVHCDSAGLPLRVAALLNESGGPDEVKSEEKVAAKRAVKASDHEFYNGMDDAKWEVAGAARALGMTRQSVYRRIKQDGKLRIATDLSVSEVLVAYDKFGGDVTAMSDHLKISRSGLRRRLQDLN